MFIINAIKSKIEKKWHDKKTIELYNIHKFDIDNKHPVKEVTFEEAKKQVINNYWKSYQDGENTFFGIGKSSCQNMIYGYAHLRINNVEYLLKDKEEYYNYYTWIKEYIVELREKSKLIPSEENVEVYLLNRLMEYVKQINVPVTWVEKFSFDNCENAAGVFVYKECLGRYDTRNSRIEILSRYKNTPFVLAHEIGHYHAINSYNNTTEQEADNQAYSLCISLLSDVEFAVIETVLNIYFKNSYLKENNNENNSQ